MLGIYSPNIIHLTHKGEYKLFIRIYKLNPERWGNSPIVFRLVKASKSQKQHLNPGSTVPELTVLLKF